MQVRQIKAIFTQMFRGKSSEDGVSSFQALSMSLAGRVGVGNIAGVATAIGFGGPGAVVWMWISALLGASTSYVESTLGQTFKEKDPKTGEYRGGPAFFLEKAYQHTRFAKFFKVYGFIFAAVTVLAMSFLLPGVQSRAIGGAVTNAWNVPTWVTALALVVIMAFIVIGGVKRIAHFASLAVPFMAVIYIIAAIAVTLLNADQVVSVIELIFTSAFGIDSSSEAAFGGIIGLAVQWGVQRGIYSNEAGQGTGPHAAAAAEVSHPTKQGLVQAGSVYIDTLFVCSATAFMILSTGMYRVLDREGEIIGSGRGQLAEALETSPGEGWPQSGLDSILPGIGASFIAISIFLFALTTIVAYYYMAETNMVFLLGKLKNPAFLTIGMRALQVLILIAVAIGVMNENPGDAWALGDIGVGAMAWLNIIGILILQQPAFKLLRDFERQRKLGLDPEFDPHALGIANATFWEERWARVTAGEKVPQG